MQLRESIFLESPTNYWGWPVLAPFLMLRYDLAVEIQISAGGKHSAYKESAYHESNLEI